MKSAARFFLGLSLLLFCSIPVGVQASDPNNIPPINDDSFEVGPEQELSRRAYYSPMLVPAAAFHSTGLNVDAFSFYFNHGVIQSDNTGANVCMYAPINIPQNATVSSLYANVIDNNATMDLSVYLTRVSKDTGISETMAIALSSGASTDIRIFTDFSIDNPDIVWQYGYFVNVCLADNTALVNARVYYSEP